MLKIGVPNYTIKSCSDFVAVLWGIMKPLASESVPECMGAIDKNIKKKKKRKGTVSQCHKY